MDTDSNVVKSGEGRWGKQGWVKGGKRGERRPSIIVSTVND